MRASSILTAGLGLVCLAGCDKLSEPVGGKAPKAVASATAPATPVAVTPAVPAVLPSDVVARVNGVPISKQDVELRIAELKTLQTGANQPWKTLTPEQLNAVLDELVSNELIGQDAVARGLDRSTETQRRWAALRRGFFVQEWLRWHQERQEPTAQDVEQFYEQYKQGFREPEWRRLRQIVIGSEAQAKQALAQLLGGSVEFAALAQQISAGPSAAQGGLLADKVMRANEKAFVFPAEADAKAAGVISLDPTLEAAAFAIDKVNSFSNYVKGADNLYHIFQLAELHPEKQRALNEVWDQIKSALTVQKIQGAVSDLRKKAKIEQFQDRLQLVTQ